MATRQSIVIPVFVVFHPRSTDTCSSLLPTDLDAALHEAPGGCSGFVTGLFVSFRCTRPCNSVQNLKLVENVKRLAAKKNATPGQMALAWLHHQVLSAMTYEVLKSVID